MKDLDRFFEPQGWQSGAFTNAEGKQIRFGHVEPAGDKKGTVIITTGYADFIESYFETIHDYLDRGYAVWAMDWVGQGGSGRKASPDEKAQRLEDHVRDLHQFRSQVVAFDADKPIFMSTHSMGGQIGLHYLQRHPKDFDFAVLAAPFMDFGFGALSRRLLQTAFSIAMKLGYGNKGFSGSTGLKRRIARGYKSQVRHQDPVRMDIHRTMMLLNPGLRAEDRTVGMMDSFFRSTAQLRDEAFLKAIQTPVLIGMAEREELIDNKALKRVAEALPAAQLVFIEDALHGLWTERQPVRQSWWGHVDEFLKTQHLRLNAPKTANDNPPVSKGPRIDAA